MDTNRKIRTDEFDINKKINKALINNLIEIIKYNQYK